MSTPCLFLDCDGTFTRSPLSHLFVTQLVREGLLPQVILSRIEEARRAYEDRKGTWEAYDDAFIKAYSGDGRLAGLRVEDARMVARHVIRERGARVHVVTRLLVNAARKCGFETALVSGSPDVVVREFAQAHGITHARGGTFPESEGRYTGEIPKTWNFDKGEHIQSLAKQYHLDLGRSVAMGDANGDLSMLEAVRFPICFNPSTDLYIHARARRWPILLERRRVYLLGFNEEGRERSLEPNEALPALLAKELNNELYETLGVLGMFESRLA